MALIDYKRAYDSVNRDMLWAVLNKIQVSSKMTRMLKAMYTSVQACVRAGSEYSDFFDCPAGVRQGCLASCLTFSLLINEVAKHVNSTGKHGVQLLPGLQEIFALLFADDVALLARSPGGLQNQITSLAECSQTLGLEVSLDKTKIMVFRKGGRLSANEKWHIHGTEIEIVNSFKYLGFTLTTKLSYSCALSEIARKGKGKVAQLLRTMYRLGNLNPILFYKLFDAQVTPTILYSSELWGNDIYDVIEKVHTFAGKRLLSVDMRTPNNMIYGETGRNPMYIQSTIRAVKYWFKIHRMQDTRFPKQAYEMQLLYEDERSWAMKMKETLFKYGFGHVWEYGGVGNEEMFLKQLSQRLKDCFMQTWNNKIQSSERFALYRQFKSVFEMEAYLVDITIKKFRDCMIRLRLGIIDINCNNRYKNTHIKRCPFCPEAIEDEHHFLFDCKAYKEPREKYLRNLFNERQESKSVSRLLAISNVDVTRKIATYIYYALQVKERELTLTPPPL